MDYVIEICANSVQSAMYAEVGGADRVELCDNLWEGGTTPSIGAIRQAVQLAGIPIFALIRPRGGDFTYAKHEFEVMKEDVVAAKEAGVKGIVSGVLTANGQIDIPRTAKLVALADPLPFTFHRAFDLVLDRGQSLEDVIATGAHRILTSGQANSAMEGLEVIRDMHQQANDRIVIMPGGGIHSDNIRSFVEAGCREFHLSAKSYVETVSEYMGRVPMNGSSEIPEDRIYVANPQLIEAIRAILDDT